MIIKRPPAVSAALVVLCLFFAPFILPRVLGEEYDQVGTRQAPDAVRWGGLKWQKKEMDGFQGRPRMASDSDTNDFILVAYDRYVCYYDLKGHAPLWVAYVTDRASALQAESRARTGNKFARPKQFFTDGVVANACELINVEATVHEDYSDCVPEGLAEVDRIPTNITIMKARSFPAIIERGHLAANNTMKIWGDPEGGRKAQYESFSLANVVPEMKRHNAPVWSSLEAQCRQWAKTLGTVCVVTGPIYSDPSHPRHIEDRKTGEKSEIPFPDSLFCVVIGKWSGKVSAIGFIMPQSTTKYSYREKAVPIDMIEQATRISFMPLLGKPNPLEQSVDQRWLNN